MELLRDVVKYCIKVDYFMCSEERGEYEEPVYLSIDTKTKRKDGTSANLIIFREHITDCLRTFDSEAAAQEYIATHTTGYNICYTNPRVVAIKYDFDAREWKEV